MLNFHRAAAGVVGALIVLGATPAICADADAPSAQSMALSKHLFMEMHMDQLMNNMMRSLVPAMIEQARKTNPALTQEQAAIVTQAVTESEKTLLDKVIDRMVPLYASTFTQKELQDLVNFYDSPSGQAMLAKMPALMSKVTPTVVEMMPEMQADIRQRICAKMDCSKITPPPTPKG